MIDSDARRALIQADVASERKLFELVNALFGVWFGFGMYSSTRSDNGSSRFRGMMLPGKMSRTNPEPFGLARVVAGS